MSTHLANQMASHLFNTGRCLPPFTVHEIAMMLDTFFCIPKHKPTNPRNKMMKLLEARYNIQGVELRITPLVKTNLIQVKLLKSPYSEIFSSHIISLYKRESIEKWAELILKEIYGHDGTPDEVGSVYQALMHFRGISK